MAAVLALASGSVLAYTGSGLPPQVPNGATLSDDAFANSNWSAKACWDTAAGQSFQAYQGLAGGNPGAYRFISETTTGNGAENVAHIYLGATYDPATQGSFDAINWSFDARLINPPGNAGLGAWFILEQGVDSNGHPVIFQSNAIGSEAGYSKITSSNWITFHEELLSASYWTSNQLENPGAPLNPDFSTAGGVIGFGFETSSAPGSASPLTYSAGFDNWSVDIVGPMVPAPEPMTLTLLAIGGLAISRRRKQVRIQHR
jgi:hypothetical protein